jgi:dipeptide/tripeptide permease
MQSKLEVSPRWRAAWSFVLVSLAVAVLQPAIPIALTILLAPVALAVFVQMAVFTHPAERPRMVALSLLMVLQLGFWIAFARIVQLALVVVPVGSVLRLEILIFAPLLLLAPAAARLCSLLDDHGLEPSAPAKFSMAYLGLAASCTCLAASIGSPISGGLVVVGLAALTFAALSLGPACMGAIVEFAPSGQRGTAVACWIAGFVFARPLGGWLHAPTRSPEATFDACLALGFGAVAAAVLSSFMWHGLQTLASMHVPFGATHSVGAVSLGSRPLSAGSAGSGSLG